MARPKDQHVRRQLMVQAAGRAIAERGLSNIRLQDIADQAGMSPGSVLYYYPELNDLLIQVHAETVEQYYQQRVGRIFADESPLLQLDAALQAGVPRSSDDLAFRLLYEMHALCEASDAHALLMQSLYERELLLFEEIINGGVRAGQFAPHLGVTDIARTLVALEDGLGLHVMSRNASSPSAGAIALLQRCAHDLVRPVEA